MTMAVAVIAIFVLPDFPSTSTWLSPEERSLAILRMSEDVGIADDATGKDEETGAIEGLRMAVMDWRVWWMSLSLTSMVVALSFNAYFPTLTATLGYSTTVSLLLCAPPWIFASIVAFFLSRYGSPATLDAIIH